MQTFLAAALLSAAVFECSRLCADRPARGSRGSRRDDCRLAGKMALKGNWRASKLMGLDVYNEANEKLGDINELILDKNGKVNAVVIGVGGFLGMGEHDIAVSMDKLKFVEEPVRTSSTAPATTARETTTRAARDTTGAANDHDHHHDRTHRGCERLDADHAMMSGTKDQLKAMPQFKYSDYN